MLLGEYYNMGRKLSFRGLLADGSTDKIQLQTIDGMKGYKITKFQLMPGNPTDDNIEVVVQIFKTATAAAAATVKPNFSDNTLLAAAYIEDNAGDDNTFHTDQVIFDNEVVNQNIFIVSSAATATNDGVNYYFELEQIMLDLNEATVATLKNLRSNSTPG